MNNLHFTIFTPSYNRAHTLHRVFESLQAQTFRDFEWVIIDDGSTDNTQQIVEDFTKNADFKIIYYKQKNQHKFYGFFKAAFLASGEYLICADSDDRFTNNTLENLKKYCAEAPVNASCICVLAKDENDKIIGQKFPQSPMSMSIFDMRYKYQIKGDKWGICKTSFYKDLEPKLAPLFGHGFIPEGVIMYHLDQQGTHYCINDPLRIYIRDEEDNVSLANSYYADKNAYGLAENFKYFINIYADKKWSYPKVLLRNLIGYLVFCAKDNRPYGKVISEVKDPLLKLISIPTYLAKPILKKKQL